MLLWAKTFPTWSHAHIRCIGNTISFHGNRSWKKDSCKASGNYRKPRLCNLRSCGKSCNKRWWLSFIAYLIRFRIKYSFYKYPMICKRGSFRYLSHLISYSAFSSRPKPKFLIVVDTCAINTASTTSYIFLLLMQSNRTNYNSKLTINYRNLEMLAER